MKDIDLTTIDESDDELDIIIKGILKDKPELLHDEYCDCDSCKQENIGWYWNGGL